MFDVISPFVQTDFITVMDQWLMTQVITHKIILKTKPWLSKTTIKPYFTEIAIARYVFSHCNILYKLWTKRNLFSQTRLTSWGTLCRATFYVKCHLNSWSCDPKGLSWAELILLALQKRYCISSNVFTFIYVILEMGKMTPKNKGCSK